MQNIPKVPKFKDEDEERAFWDTHSGADYFDPANIVNLQLPNLRPSTERITIRVSRSLLDNIKKIANKKDVPYQSLIKVYLDKIVSEELPTAVQ